MVDLPPVPAAVVEFAQQNGLTNIQQNNSNIDNYKVYYAKFLDPQKGIAYILYNNSNIRFAKPDEIKELIRVYNIQ